MLLARDEVGLKSCKDEIAKEAPSVNVIIIPYDLSDVSKPQEVVSKVPVGQYDELLLVYTMLVRVRVFPGHYWPTMMVPIYKSTLQLTTLQWRC